MALGNVGLPPRRSHTVVWMVGVAVAVLLGWRWGSSPQLQASPAARNEAASAPLTRADESRAVALQKAMAKPQAPPVGLAPTWHADELGIAHDLQRVFDAHIGTVDPRLQQTAVRALAACAPAFMPSAGETPSPEALIGALPKALHAEREAAYRTIYARCAPFLGIGRDKLSALQRSVLASDVSREAGSRALSDLAAGNDEIANQRIGRTLASGDTVAVASLAGVAEAWARRSSVTPASPTRLAASRALDAALPWVACDLGMACGNDSLAALQACATQGQCAGDWPARLAGGALPDAAERAATQAQRERLLGLLKTGRALTMADLLP